MMSRLHFQVLGLLLSWFCLIPLLRAENPAVVQIYHYPPNEYCDLDNPRDQTAFYGPEFELAVEIIENIEWLETQYQVDFYCICCNDVIRDAVLEDFHMTEVGKKYLFTAYFLLISAIIVLFSL